MKAKAIPISEIDSFIERFKRPLPNNDNSFTETDEAVLELLENLRKKAIPAVSKDELVKELQEIYNLGIHWEARLRLDKVIKDLKE